MTEKKWEALVGIRGPRAEVRSIRTGKLVAVVENEEEAKHIAALPQVVAALRRVYLAGTLNDQEVIDQMIAALRQVEGMRT